MPLDSQELWNRWFHSWKSLCTPKINQVTHSYRRPESQSGRSILKPNYSFLLEHSDCTYENCVCLYLRNTWFPGPQQHLHLEDSIQRCHGTLKTYVQWKSHSFRILHRDFLHKRYRVCMLTTHLFADCNHRSRALQRFQRECQSLTSIGFRKGGIPSRRPNCRILRFDRHRNIRL
jgi:hypothetical protein